MGKHSNPDCRQCRREGERLFLKGERCNSAKCALARRNSAPGQHGAAIKKHSDYALRLREKQKLRRIFGISEKQLRAYFDKARKAQGVTGTLLLQQLELRLDNIVFRLGLAASRKQARLLVKHGHFRINGKKVDLPGYPVHAKDTITIRERSLTFLTGALEKAKETTYPAWISFNPETKTGILNTVPERTDIDFPIAEQMIVEYYSK